MRTIPLPGTDLAPAALCFGGVSLCTETDVPASLALLDAYRDRGGNFVDSANVYGKWLPSGRNVCDEIIGRWLRERGRRDRMIVATKIGHPPLGDMLHPRLAAADLRDDLEQSLRALGIEAIDLLYLHRDDPSLPVEGIVDALNAFVREGKVRYLGASNWSVERIEAAQAYARASGQLGFCANQMMYSCAVPDLSRATDPLLRAMDAETHAYHARTGLCAVAYSSQAHGLFQKVEAAGFGALDASLAGMYGSSENERRWGVVRRIARDIGAKVGDVALAYVLSQPFPTVAIVGSRTMAQLEDSLTAADVRLSEAQVRAIDGGR